MAIKNYYAILGVSRNETPSGIRAAYRDAVRRTHPDYAGPEAATKFQEIVEAHSVLSDPDRRREYNESLGGYERDRGEPGLPPRAAADWEPQSTFADLHTTLPPFGALDGWLMRNFTSMDVPRVERSEGLSVDVILTREEAARGGSFSVDVPVHEVCRSCGGTGNDWLFSCLPCAGEGTVLRVQRVQVRVPQSLRLGLTSEVFLQTFRIKNLFVNLRIRVSKE